MQHADTSWMDYLGTPEPLDQGVSDPENVALSVDPGFDEKQPSDGTDAIESPKVSC